jgi:urease accessory protein
MKDLNQPRSLALLGGAMTLACLGLAGPAQAHTLPSQAGLLSGVLHPLLGVDHLLLLIAVGTAACALSPVLLAWALAGGLVGGVIGAMGGQLPGLELLAALAISAVGVLALQANRPSWVSSVTPAGAVVALSVTLHAMLHGQEVPADGSAALWWIGALVMSSVVCAGSYALLRRLPQGWTQRLALLLVVLGGMAALSL